MYTKALKFAAATLLLGTSLLATSCDKSSELSDIPEVKPELKGVGFSIEPMALREWKAAGRITRATAQSETERDIHFTAGDLLYVEGIQYDQANNPVANIVGNLTMDSGAGQKEATFSGDLYAPEGSTLDDFEDITYYLIGANDKRAKLIDVEGVDVKAVELPLGDNHIVASFTEAIEKYSEIGYLAPKFTNEVKLQQSNAYFVFNIPFVDPSTFDNVADIKATFVRPDGSTLVVTTEEKPTGFKLDEKGILKVVVPCAIEDEKEQFTDIKLAVNIQNGKSFVQSFPSESEAGNTVAHGEVYVLECTSDPSVSLDPMQQEDWYSALYTVRVNSNMGTRAHPDNDYFYEELYFSEGDKLYIESKIDTYRCYGTLALASGADSQNAIFTGELNIPQGKKLSDFTGNVYYTLISEADELRIWEDDAKTELNPDRKNKPFIAGGIVEAVEKYSNIGCVSGNGFTNSISLKQNNAFLNFSINLPLDMIYIDEITEIKATFSKYYDKSTEVISTKPDYSFVINEESFQGLNFVVPFNVVVNEIISDLRIDIATKNGRKLEVSIPCDGENGKLMQSGVVYNVYNVNVEAPTLSSSSQVGDIGPLDGLMGMVVDLKGVKKAIAMYNLGAEEGNIFDPGYFLPIAQMNEKRPGNWKFPSYNDCEAFAAQYSKNMEVTGIGDAEFSVWHIAENRDLLLQRNIQHKSESDYAGDYFTTEWANWPNWMFLFGVYLTDDGIEVKYRYDYVKNDQSAYARLIHDLSDN